MKNTIKTRATLKVMVDEASPWPCPEGQGRDLLIELMDYGSWAPFHYECHAMHRKGPQDSPVPWRFHALDTGTCRSLLKRLRNKQIQTGKIGGMLAAATGMVMATWLPDPPAAPAEAASIEAEKQQPTFQSFAPTLRNMEHIAAASAAIQNMLLVATENGLPNYWSSGGKLRTELVFDWLDIPRREVLLGAIFLFPQQTSGAVTKTGAWRNKRGERRRWSRGIALPELESDPNATTGPDDTEEQHRDKLASAVQPKPESVADSTAESAHVAPQPNNPTANNPTANNPTAGSPQPSSLPTSQPNGGTKPNSVSDDSSQPNASSQDQAGTEDA